MSTVGRRPDPHADADPARGRLRQRPRPRRAASAATQVDARPATTPARSASARSRSPTTSRPSPARRSRPGPRNIWRYQALLPVPDRHRPRAPTPSPASPGCSGPTTWPASSASSSLWVKDDSTNPTNSFKDRVVACALSAARELGAKVFACPSTGNLANAVAAAGARAGIKTVVFIPSDLEQPKQVNSAVYTEHAGRGERQLRRRQPARLRDRRRGGGLGVRQRQRPPVLRRGLQDAGLRDRRAARLAAARPGRDPGRLRARS